MIILAVLISRYSCSNDDNNVTIPISDPDTTVNSIPCKNGMAGEYPCAGYDFVARIPLSTMQANSGNDSWGWTDPTTEKEYAIMGLNNGTAFIDISIPDTPIYLGKLPTATTNSSWRDIKVYQNHAFIVSEADDHGMQVFDLTRLRNVSNPPQTFTSNTRYTEFGNAHNIVINEDSGYAYIVGAQRNTGHIMEARYL